MPTLYEVLGAPEAADHAELRRAFRARARALHPDLHPDVDTTSAMRALNEAWAVLGDTEARSAYDRELAAARRRERLRAVPPSPPAGPRRPADRDLDPDERFDADLDARWGGPDGWDGRDADAEYVDSGVLSVPRWVHRCVVGVIAAVIIGLVVVTAHAGPSTSRSGRDPGPAVLEPTADATGRCVVLFPSAGLVECTGLAARRVVSEIAAGDGGTCPVGSKSVQLSGRPSTLCVEGL
jgi:hypothetical protein